MEKPIAIYGIYIFSECFCICLLALIYYIF